MLIDDCRGRKEYQEVKYHILMSKIVSDLKPLIAGASHIPKISKKKPSFLEYQA